jgi:capsular exopolysaccharide synthesis family protein
LDGLLDRAVAENDETNQLAGLIQEKRTRLLKILEVSAQGTNDPFYLRLQNEIARDEKTLGDVRQQVRDLVKTKLEEQAVNQRKDALVEMENKLGSYEVLRETLKTRLEEEMDLAKKLSGDKLDLEFKQRELEQATVVYNLITERAVKLYTEQMAPARVTKEREATPPVLPLEATPYKMMFVAMMASFCLPFGIAVVWERVFQRVSTPEVLENQVNVQVIGEIVRLPSSGSRALSNRASRGLKLFEESIDGLRTNLFLSPVHESLRVLCVVSACENEGKTSVACQLAVSIARASHSRTLLIDGDMRQPDIHHVFDIRRDPGLAEVLAGEAELEDAIVTDWSDYLHFLPAGDLTSSPHRLLGNGNLDDLLDRVPLHYRYVVIDTPPILSASESLVMAKAADATIFCVMQDVSRVDQVLKAHQRLMASGAVTAGTVVSGVATRQYKYRYGNYSYATYG